MDRFVCFRCEHYVRREIHGGFTSLCLVNAGNLRKDMPRIKCKEFKENPTGKVQLIRLLRDVFT